ncbi:MAG: hydrolase TatD, partial [Alphaproteobacteria bacterium]|nr:hydrolase TatD [Candidatus Fonsibacter sp. PEL55]
TGGLEFAKKLLDLGCFISFSGIITFKKSSDLRDVVKYVPIEKMLIETDSPYLSPDPFRGKSNEPANVKIVAENVALIKEISFEDVANITTKNFKDFFFND